MSAVLTASHPDLLGISPELALAAAVVHRFLRDARSDDAEIRADALAVLHDEAAVRFWDDLLGADGALAQRVQAAVREHRYL